MACGYPTKLVVTKGKKIRLDTAFKSPIKTYLC